MVEENIIHISMDDVSPKFSEQNLCQQWGGSNTDGLVAVFPANLNSMNKHKKLLD